MEKSVLHLMCLESSLTTAQAIAVPSYVAVPRPSSSTRTSECLVACLRIVDVSLSSTKNVLSPMKRKICCYRPLSRGGHVESQENKKLCFCTARLALNSRLAEACRAKTKLFILLILNMAPRDKGSIWWFTRYDLSAGQFRSTNLSPDLRLIREHECWPD